MSIEEAKRQIKERGYSRMEMKDIQTRLNRERREWLSKFDDYVDQLNYSCESMPVKILIQRAEQLADARQALIERRFPDGVQLEIPDEEE